MSKNLDYKKCWSCDGNKKTSDGKKCPTCRGTGHVAIEKRRIASALQGSKQAEINKLLDGMK